MSTSNPPPTTAPDQPITTAFLGPTGGCTLTTLTLTLLSPHPRYYCTALARDPAKLTALLLAQEGITAPLVEARLKIIRGDARDPEAVKRVLRRWTGPTPAASGVAVDGEEEGDEGVVDVIVSGLGGTPKLQWSVRKLVTLDDPTVCQEAARAVVEALRELQGRGKGKGKGSAEGTTKGEKKKKPLLAFISTTGISHGKEDVPFGLGWLWHYVLAVPHEDKRVMEAVFRGQGGEEGDRGVFRSVVGVRPSLLLGSGDVGGLSSRTGTGTRTVRVGRERAPAVGYWIKRAEVGRWLFDEVVERGAEGWEGEMVTLTY